MYEKRDDYTPTTARAFYTSRRPSPLDPRIDVGVYSMPSVRASHMSSYSRNMPRYQSLG